MPPRKPKAKTVKIRLDVYNHLVDIATFNNVDLQDYISDKLAPLIEDEWTEVIRKKATEAGLLGAESEAPGKSKNK